MRFLTFALAAFFLTGCHSPDSKTPVAAPPIRVEWIGHTCFRIVSSIGITVVTDPFNPKILTYPAPPKLDAEVLLISHEDETSNHSDLLSNNPQIFRTSLGLGTNRAGGIPFSGVGLSSEGNGLNVAFAWTMDGVRFCFLGSPQDAPTAAQAEAIGAVDVLFLPVGSPAGFTDAERTQTIELLRPRIIVPMGYRTRYTAKRVLGPLDSFLAGRPNVVWLPSSSFSLSRNSLPAAPVFMVPATP